MYKYINLTTNDLGEYVFVKNAAPSDIDVYSADFANKLDAFFAAVSEDLSNAINDIKTNFQTKTEFETDISIVSGAGEGPIMKVLSNGIVEIYASLNKFIGALLFETLKVTSLTADSITTNGFKVVINSTSPKKYLVFDSVEGLYFLTEGEDTKNFIFTDESITFNSNINFNNNVYINGLLVINTSDKVKIGCMEIEEDYVRITKPVVTTGEIYIGSVSEENKLSTGDSFIAKINEVQATISEQELNLKQFYDRFNIGNFKLVVNGIYYTVFTDTFKTRTLNVPVFLTGSSTLNVDGFTNLTTSSIEMTVYTCDDNGNITGTLYGTKDDCRGNTEFDVSSVITEITDQKIKQIELSLQYTNSKQETTNCFVNIIKL